ncbi:MAG: hypothetical protein K1X74_08915 [Pirellulales bacterium]|nr:hypothetical protein [Pirellulales bacterium]
MSRKRIGAVALLLGVVAGLLWLFGPAGAATAQASAACLRIGTVLGAIWLALPQLQAWTSRLVMAALLALALVLALWPKLFVLAVIALVIAALLRPRLAPDAPQPAAHQPGKSR